MPGKPGQFHWGPSGVREAWVTDFSAVLVPATVDIDIKPGDKRNIINPRARGGIWVAVLSDTDPESPFDHSSQVDIPTVEVSIIDGIPRLG